jgi:serine protease AprX
MGWNKLSKQLMDQPLLSCLCAHSNRHLTIVVMTFLLLGLSVTGLQAQVAPRHYVIFFTDKTNSAYSLNHPAAFLSEKSIERRNKSHIPIDSLDLPVNAHYVDSVLQFGFASVKYKSKWNNAVVLFVLDSSIVEDIASLPMVRAVRKLPEVIKNSIVNKLEPVAATREFPDPASNPSIENFYGGSYDQIAMMNGHMLHAMGYTGQGIHVAILDAGWDKANLLPTFQRAYDQQRLLSTRDFVFEINDPVYHASAHGTYVWSIMAGHSEGQQIGAAYDAGYHLIRTENPGSEQVLEEYNWIAGAEYADSVGVDIINSSLGYSEFDWSVNNYTYQDMNGSAAVSSRGAQIAAEKGILVVNSAGNSGDDPWFHITAPSDALDVLCVGATWPDSSVAWFSSRGPASNGIIKPNVAAQGVGVWIALPDSTFASGNGTSFSAPLVAGLAACLWQAFPDITNKELMQVIQMSAHQAHHPNAEVGYGVPDFWKAYEMLASLHRDDSRLHANIWPNPSSGNATILLMNEQASEVECTLYDTTGRRIDYSEGALQSGSNGLFNWQAPAHLAAGLYYFHLHAGDRHSVLPWVLAHP